MNKKISVIIPAAGLATRMRPLSSSMSKSMIPVNGKPIISYIIDFLKDNVDEFIIIQGKNQDIQDFVERNYSDINVKFTHQPIQNGPLQAIKFGWEIANKENSILIWLGDTICFEENLNFDLDNFLVVHNVENKERWCLVDTNTFEFYDKPTYNVPSDLALIGIYYFKDRNIFNEKMNQAVHLDDGTEIKSLLVKYPHFDLINTNEWYDCGDLKTFYESRARLITRHSREMNQINIDLFRNVITKTASDPYKEKIEMEKKWFISLYDEQKLFVPRIFNSDYGILKMSWESGTPLNEMLIYDNILFSTMKDVFDKTLDIYFKIFYNPADNYCWDKITPSCYEMYVQKNLQRLENYCDWPRYEEVYDFVKNSGKMLMTTIKWSDIIHGDLHSGNIIVDPLNGSQKWIDPRGKFGKYAISAGDAQYDMGKIFHDIFLGYNFILAKKFSGNQTIKIHWNEETMKNLCLHVAKRIEAEGFNVMNILKLSVVFLFTCLPFHTDDRSRQMAFWNRALNVMDKINNSENFYELF